MKKLRQFENFHIALWLLKDTFWVANLQVLAMIMIIPTLSLSIYITWKSKHEVSELWHNMAVCLWICANTTWMIGEFFYDDKSRPYATGFFIAGLAAISYYYLFPARLKLKEEKA